MDAWYTRPIVNPVPEYILLRDSLVLVLIVLGLFFACTRPRSPPVNLTFHGSRPAEKDVTENSVQ